MGAQDVPVADACVTWLSRAQAFKQASATTTICDEDRRERSLTFA
jgi:hypothetical protein